MGSRTDQTLNEIETARERLAANLAALEERLPPLVRRSKRIAQVATGTVGGSVALFVARKALRVAKRGVKKRGAATAISAPPTIIVRPTIGLPAVLVVAAVAAGVRIYETRLKAQAAAAAGGELRALPGRKPA